MVAPNDLVVLGRNVRQTEQRGQMIYEFADAWIKLFDSFLFTYFHLFIYLFFIHNYLFFTKYTGCIILKWS